LEIKYNVKNIIKTDDEKTEIEKELIFNEKLLKVILFLEKNNN